MSDAGVRATLIGQTWIVRGRPELALTVRQVLGQGKVAGTLNVDGHVLGSLKVRRTDLRDLTKWVPVPSSP